MSTNSISIFIDADACPVKSEIERVANRHKIKTYVVSNGGIRPSQNPLLNLVVVSKEADAADIWISENMSANDIVVTSDIVLAANVIEKGARVIKPTGEILNGKNIGEILAMRDLMYDIRAADPFRQSGGTAFSKNDRSRFLDGLERLARVKF
ncbi:MAG: YaiI/YqxD family protein [Paracoccaceae bacterium]|jgi:uncharacterized protein YaiI (UPF0178 family)|nr:hypothetical protein [Marinovum sp.]|tara:strand:- start:185 stop:643 length:459 start_codon:yes stop_codon:yes gene_type:complete